MIPYDLNTNDLVALIFEGEIPTIGRVDLVASSTDTKLFSFLGDRRVRPHPLKGILPFSIEVFYRRCDETGEFLDMYEAAGPCSFLKRYFDSGGSLDDLDAGARALFP